jgi:hypothetical protein
MGTEGLVSIVASEEDTEVTVVGRRFDELVIDEDEIAANTEDEEKEQMFLRGARHVKALRVQRKLLDTKVSKALSDTIHNIQGEQCIPHSECTRTLIVDYGQNMEMPWLGKAQPGDAYYYTPLHVYNLGIIDSAQPRIYDEIEDASDHRFAHVYHEGTGAKGSNNVASLIIKTVHRLKWLKSEEEGYELNIVFDNCKGQKKTILCCAWCRIW